MTGPGPATVGGLPGPRREVTRKASRRGPGARSRLLEAAVLAVLAGWADDQQRDPSAALVVWPTGELERTVSGHQWRDYARLLAVLNRLAGRGRAAKFTQPAGLSAYWRWLPSEGDCDDPGELVRLDCDPSWCMRETGGCQSCWFWAARNLPERKNRPRARRGR